MALPIRGLGDSFPSRGYAVYEGGTVLAGAEPYRYALTPRTGFLLEMEEIPSDVLGPAKLVYLNYPNNPTAAIAPREYLEPHGRVLFASTESSLRTGTIHTARSRSMTTWRPVSSRSRVRVTSRFEFHSLSKTFCMTGWRLRGPRGDRS